MSLTKPRQAQELCSHLKVRRHPVRADERKVGEGASSVSSLWSGSSVDRRGGDSFHASRGLVVIDVVALLCEAH